MTHGNATHGDSHTRLHNIWVGMKNRCQNPNNDGYPKYGGRGITVCAEWQQYESFRDWAIANGYDSALTIDRIDNNGPYEPTNCRWVTAAAQQRNTRKTVLITAFGETKILAEWAADDRCTITAEAISWRLGEGWEAEEAITAPPHSHQRVSATQAMISRPRTLASMVVVTASASLALGNVCKSGVPVRNYNRTRRTVGLFEDWATAAKAKKSLTNLSKEVIKHIDRYDRQDIDRITKEMRDARTAQDRLAEISPETGDNLTIDTMMGFYKVDPQMRDAAEMRPSHLINRLVQEELQQTNEWERLRTWTEGDIVSAAAAFVTVEPDLEALLDKTKKQQEKAKKAMEEYIQFVAAQQGQRDIDEMVEEWKNAGDLTPEELQNMEDMQARIAESMAQAQAEAEAAADSFEAQASNAVAGAMPGLRAAMADAADAAEELASNASGWGIDQGQLQRMSAKERIELAKKLNSNDRFKKLTALIGPMTRIAQAEQTRKVYFLPDEVYDVTTGNDLSRVLPSELLGIRHPSLKLEFRRKFVEGKLLEYKMRGTEKVGKGSIIFMMDNSGSMMGDPEVWAKATGLACASIARDQKRSFYGIHFGSRHELKTFDFRKPEDMTFDRIVDYAEFFFGGGTDFVAPLSLGLKLLQDEEKQKGYIEGDIVFVTDGYCGVPDNWLKEFKEEQERLGFKVYGILIGNPSQREMEPLWTICDHQVVTITDLLSGDAVRDMFRAL